MESGKAERSGAEKEAKKHLSIHSLAQRTNQETSTLTKASPYMERMQHRKSQKPSIFFRFGIAGHAMSILKMLPTEDVYMSAGLKEQERKFIVILLPSHEPIRFYMAFPLPLMVTL